LSSNEPEVPFNDLLRIHAPLMTEFKDRLEKIILGSSFVLGSEVEEFEKSLAKIENAPYAIGVNSGTSALELALRACEIGEGDEVISTALTFVATCFSILQVGATPVLVDITPESGLIDLNRIQSAITPRTKAIIFVSLHGRVDHLAELQEICTKNDLKFIIDAAQSHLGTYRGISQSSYCDAATLSFYPGKNLGALGEGGAVITNSDKINKKIRIMRDWGATEKYTHTEWGGNFRLEPIQAAFLSIKLSQLHDWTRQRQEIASFYSANIFNDVLLNEVSKDGSHVYHIFSLQVSNRSDVISTLQASRIGFGIHYPRAIHQNEWYRSRVKILDSLKNAEEFATKTLSLPLFPGQTHEEASKVVNVVNSLMNK